jgi:hypothetical protein
VEEAARCPGTQRRQDIFAGRLSVYPPHLSASPSCCRLPSLHRPLADACPYPSPVAQEKREKRRAGEEDKVEKAVCLCALLIRHISRATDTYTYLALSLAHPLTAALPVTGAPSG